MAAQERFALTKQDKRLMVAGLGLAMLALILFLTLPALVDTNAIQNQIKASFKSSTGLDLEIQDGMEVSIFPSPHVTVKNLYVANIPGASSSFLLSIRSMDMKLHTTSLFSANPTADSVVLDGVVMQIERMKSGRFNWQEIKQYTAKNAVKDTELSPRMEIIDNDDVGQLALARQFVDIDSLIQGLIRVSNIKVLNAELHYTDSPAGIVTHYNDIKFDFVNDRSAKIAKLAGGLYYGGFPASISVELNDIEESYKRKTTSAKVRLESEQTFFEYEGDIGFADTLSMKGKTVFESPNLAQWIKLLNEKAGVSVKLPAGAKSIPVKLSSSVATEGKNILLPEIAVEGGIFSGKLAAIIKPPVNIEIKGTLDSIDMDSIVASGLFTSSFSKQAKKADGTTSSDDGDTVSLNMLAQKSFWSYITIGVSIKVADVSYNKQRIKKGLIEFDMADGDMAISQISGSFPGESKLLFTGLGKESYQGFMVDGQLDGSGENFVDMIAFFRTSNAASLPKDFKRFRFKTNMVLSSKELRLTELSSRVENMAFVGGIITTFEDIVKVQAAIRMGGVDVDRLMQSWGVNKFIASLYNEDMSTVKADDELSQWLRSVAYDLDVRVSAEQFTLHGKPQEKGKIRASVTKNKLMLTELEIVYDGTQFGGKASLDVSGKLPYADIDLSMDTIDLTSQAGQKSWVFDASADGTAQKGKRSWSRQGISFSWMDFLNANMHFRIGHIRNGEFEATSLDIKAAIEDRTLTLPAVAGSLLGAQFTGKGFIKNGKIPSLSLTGDLINLDVNHLTGFMPALAGLSGRVNSQMRLNTSGIDVYTWLYNMQGTILLSSRDATIDGFNLPGIVNAVGYVRTVADILDAVKRAFPGGSTVFNVMDGEISMGNGVMKIPTSSLRNDLAEGEFVGQVDLMNWKMVGKLSLAITYLDRVTPPKMAISYRGNLDEIEKELDTSLLEQYVANKTSEKLLQSGEQ